MWRLPVAAARSRSTTCAKPSRPRTTRCIGFVLGAGAAGLAAAHELADTEHWRRDLATAFKAIVQREGLTRRHAALRRVRARFKSELNELLGV